MLLVDKQDLIKDGGTIYINYCPKTFISLKSSATKNGGGKKQQLTPLQKSDALISCLAALQRNSINAPTLISIFKLHDTDFVYCVVRNYTTRFHNLTTLLPYLSRFWCCNLQLEY